MSCEGCEASAMMQNKERDSVIEKAKQYAKEKNMEMAVYQEAGQWKYIRADIAIEEHYPIFTIISQYYAS
jgi:hypothetical protein